jgi:hypothetical protein
MFNKRKILGAVIAALVLSIPAPAGLKKGDKGAVRSGEITGNEVGLQLAQLSPGQIRDAFRAAGYTAAEIEGFSTVLVRTGRLRVCEKT